MAKMRALKELAKRYARYKKKRDRAIDTAHGIRGGSSEVAAGIPAGMSWKEAGAITMKNIGYARKRMRRTKAAGRRLKKGPK